MTTVVAPKPDTRALVRKALEAFKSDSSYTAEMVQAARALEGKKKR